MLSYSVAYKEFFLHRNCQLHVYIKFYQKVMSWLSIYHQDYNPRSIPSRSFLREAIEGISFYLNNICYKALEDLRERAEIHAMNQAFGESFFEQQAYGESFLERQAYGESFFEQQAYEEYLNNRVPISPEHLLTKIKALYTNTSKHHGEGTSSRSIRHPTSHVPQDRGEEVYERQSTSRLATLLENLSLREKHNDGIMQQLSDVPRDERTLFVTFSNGYPLTKDELYDFFMRHYGDIEEITIEEPMEQRPPLYAHVTFFSQLTLFRVLDGNKKVKFMTRQKHLWARQYVPKKKKTKPNELNPFS
ncbi:uncharacterized protein LOC100825065 isoform X2 [Brachypodium distachyon]|uniref:RRM domain-containing protein n=1 Tax=Brachypodium distachyon TaxID=15368 RepID=A0A0Q3NRN7_BRADI|nr:uncharacterized protein LOC100825065 isoform X2 [Brachypodium distachyon]KQK20174.1 hypothetical protein BRADI_1g52980v3 [Brachypodium distachyon]|eukprot:XP_010228181.1 uncharacterized protein LOC100825065 isoform X2 [Brachypodium distachyon]